MKNKILLYLVFILLISSCASKKTGEEQADCDFQFTVDSMKYARNIEISEIDRGEGSEKIHVVTIRNPWDSLKKPERYVLVPRGTNLPSGLPEGKIIRTPVKNALIYSAVHSGLVGDLGAGDAIGGVCNAGYVTDKGLKERIAGGAVVDCGDEMSPDLEKIIQLNPEIIMLSPFENNDRYAKVVKLGIPLVECGDYMETSALGQAEWMRFYGLLFGKGEEAKNRFSEIERHYNALKAQAAGKGKRPKVLLDQTYGQSWSVPGGGSTMGRLIEDAGGINPFSRYRQSGGVPLAPERVLAEADDADVWIVRYNQKNEKTLRELSRDAGVNSQFKAFKLGNVYGCNTQYVPFFDETPFHPDLLLEDMILVIHGDEGERGEREEKGEDGRERSDKETTRYFKKMKR